MFSSMVSINIIIKMNIFIMRRVNVQSYFNSRLTFPPREKSVITSNNNYKNIISIDYIILGYYILLLTNKKIYSLSII